MAETTTNSAEELALAYNKAISSGFSAVDAGMAQTTAALKLMTGAVKAERTEYGKVWEQAATHARKRNENVTALFPAIFQGMASTPVNSIPTINPEAKESVNKIIESEMAFYQAWTKTWMDYLSGMETRRSAAALEVLESNAKAIASSQAALKNTVKFGETIIDWSLESVNATKS
jgi:hypothetical protein